MIWRCFVHPLMFLLISVSNASPATAEQPLRLTGPAVRETLPFLRMIENPPCVPGMHGAVFMPWSSPEQLRSLIATKKVDVALMTIASAAALYNKGVPCTVVAVYSSPVWIVSTDQDLTGFNDLDEQEIMLPFGPGEMPELSLRILMEKRKMRFLPRHMGSALEAVSMLRSGRGQHTLLAEPAASKALTAFESMGIETGKSPRKYFNICELWAESFPQSPEMPFGAVVVFGPLAKNRMACGAIRANYLKNVHLTREHPENTFMTTRKAFPALEKHLKGMKKEEACDIRIVTSEHVAASVNFFLARLFELSPASIGGKMPDDDFLELSDAPR